MRQGVIDQSLSIDLYLPYKSLWWILWLYHLMHCKVPLAPTFVWALEPHSGRAQVSPSWEIPFSTFIITLLWDAKLHNSLPVL